MNTQSQRKCLVYCPVKKHDILAEMFADDRCYDIALHDYSGSSYQGRDDVEYMFAGPGHKWACIKKNLPRLGRNYDYYVFLDNDIGIDTGALNRLFEIARKHSVQLIQPSLTRDSFGSHAWLYQRRFNKQEIRKVPFVELMMPLFSHRALQLCEPTFLESESGWGLDLLWAHLLKGEVGITDSVAALHAKPVESHGWRLSNGKSVWQEREEIMRDYGIDPKVLVNRDFLFSLRKRWLSLRYKALGRSRRRA